jgi:hypothetical protein
MNGGASPETMAMAKQLPSRRIGRVPPCDRTVRPDEAAVRLRAERTTASGSSRDSERRTLRREDDALDPA